MNKTSKPPAAAGSGSHCLLQVVGEAMQKDPTIEAVKVNRADHTLAVAGMGQAPSEAAARRLTEEVQRLQEQEGDACCLLQERSADCQQCREPQPVLPPHLKVEHRPEETIVARVTCPTAPRFWRWRQWPLPRLVPREVELAEEIDESEWRGQMVAAVLCGLLALGGYLIQSQGWAGSSSEAVGVLLYLLAYVAGSWFNAHEVWERLQKGVLDVHFLMLAVAVGSAAIGHWGEGATLLFLFSFSGALEHYALGRTQREIRSLFRTAPKTAVVLDAQGREQTVPVEQLQAGQRLLIKPGEQFPVDAEVIKGSTAADESNLTGEATPVPKAVGDTVLAGTLNLWGGVEVTVLRPASQSALQKIIELIQQAQHLKAPSQRFTDKFGTGYTYAVLGLCLVMFFVWWLGLGLPPFKSAGETRSAFYRAMTLLVVASPCALVLSIPSAVLAAIAWAARRGILFRGGAAVENLAGIQVVALDKTGTLTTGELRVDRIESFPPGREAEVAQLAYSLERLSHHPLARAITAHGKRMQLQPLELEDFTSHTGLGLQARLNGVEVRLGRREWLAEGPAGAIVAQAPPTDTSHSEVWVCRDGLVGRILLRDDVRPAAREVIRQLRAEGLQTVVLTGDRQAAARQLQEELGLDDVRAELKPEQKVAAIVELTRQGRRVAMVGDGVNDAPSLAAADVGVAMGARGSDAALEQAEVVLMHDRLENFHTAYQLSRRARQVIRQNLIISLGTVVVLVVCAIWGTIPLTVGVVGHEGSTVIVVLNSLRLLLQRQPGGAGFAGLERAPGRRDGRR
ncbi:MAG: heavy metal translocating P-type ATPase [Verrucomicrobiae bacterium]|nr:heavy metal translocating P-type ATPase [Verrucomicrobiae bacterium]